MLEDLGIGDANPEFGCRLLDRRTFQESKLQDPPVIVRQLLENTCDPLRGGADRLLALGWLLDVVDRGDLSSKSFTPARGQYGPRGCPQVATNLTDAGGQP